MQIGCCYQLKFQSFEKNLTSNTHYGLNRVSSDCVYVLKSYQLVVILKN